MGVFRIEDRKVEIEAPNWESIVVRAPACEITIDTYEQNGAGASAAAVDIHYDLTVRGTGNPDNKNITGMFAAAGRTHPLTIIKVGGMAWYAVVLKEWFPPAGMMGYVYVNKVCAAPPGANASDALKFV